jgi:phosphate transport system substrate-binding protein
MGNDMNDDFLHRLRSEPNPKFLTALKARLDRQAIDHGKARRTLFRTAILAALIGGSAVAVAFVAWRGVPHPFGGIAQVRDAQDKRSGGGAQKMSLAPAPGRASTPGATPDAMPAAAASEGAATPRDAGPVGPSAPGSDAPHSVFSVAGVGGIIVNAQNFVRRPVELGLMTKPQFTQTTTVQAMAMLCHVRGSAGADSATADVAGADRRMMASELAVCMRNGVSRVTELRVGYEVVVLARSKLYGAPKLSARDIFLGLAAYVPDPNQPQSLIKNPYHVWNAIDSTLSEEQIEIFGPPLSSLTAAAFRRTVMEAGCVTFPGIAAIKSRDPERFEKVCQAIRTDGVYRDLGYVVGNMVEHLDTYPNAMALLNLREMPTALVAASVDGVEPTWEAIAADSYVGSRTLYLYLNAQRAAANHALSDFVMKFERTALDPGSDLQLVPLAEDQRQIEMRNVMTLPDVKL